MNETELGLPSQAQYEAAFAAIEPKMTAKQRDMLVFHLTSTGRFCCKVLVKVKVR